MNKDQLNETSKLNQATIYCSYRDKKRGGVENWMHFLGELIEENGVSVEWATYREGIIKFFYKVVLSIKSSIIILSSWKLLVFAAPLLFFKRKRFLIFFHGNEIYDLNIFSIYLLRFASRRENFFFICNSQFTKNLLEGRCGEVGAIVVHPFIDARTVHSECLNPFGEFEGLKFCSVTRLAPRKNIDSVIRSLGNLKRSGELTSFKYLVAGEGGERNNLEKLAKSEGVETEVIFLGLVEEVDKFKLLSNADIFLLPSIHDISGNSVEGFGMVFLEANSFGLPVISGCTGGMPEAVLDGVTGIISSGATEDLTGKILTATQKTWERNVIKDWALRHDVLLGDGSKLLLRLLFDVENFEGVN